MRACSRLIGLLVLAVFILGTSLLKETFAQEKIAFVDLGLVFDGYLKTKDYDVNLESLQKEKQKEIENRVNSIKGMQDKLSLLSEKEKKEKQEQIDKETRELQEFQRDAEMDLREERDEKLKEILQDIQDIVQEVAKQKNYDFIINERTLLYGNDKFDISKEILDILNEKYKKKK